jgi:hypothetical protein
MHHTGPPPGAVVTGFAHAGPSPCAEMAAPCWSTTMCRSGGSMRIGGPETVILLPLVAAANQSLRGYFEPQRGGAAAHSTHFLVGAAQETAHILPPATPALSGLPIAS